MRSFKLLGYAAIPCAFLTHFWLGRSMAWEPVVTFLLAALGIIPLAALMGEATEHLAERAGPTWGGLLNATFGNAAELIIGVIALSKGMNEVVKASLTGSILGNLLLVAGMAMTVLCPAADPPAPYGPVPSARQIQWHEMEFYGFLHFTVNTFTDKEWGFGDEDEKVFNPTAFNADQIARTAKEAGMRLLILTAKHHDGFCLWPSKLTEHSVKGSPWKGGAGDVVREISEACRRQGLKFGVYLSPWDRNHKDYGRSAYVEYYKGQLRELLTNYGDIAEVWFDGANGGDGFYGGAREARRIDAKTYYDWEDTRGIVRKLQPNACMFSDVGPDVRWVGNEGGHAGNPCWATIDMDKVVFGAADTDQLNRGDRPGTHWIPAECDVSIRPGWFYHASENSKVRTPANLMDLHFASVGRGGSLLLNIPPDRRGLLHENDVKSLLEFGRILRETFGKDLAAGAKASASNFRGGDPAFGPSKAIDGDRKTYWATDDAVREAELVLDLGRPAAFGVVRIREHLPLGQRVEGFAVDARVDGAWRELGKGQSIGPCRLIRFLSVTADAVRLRITKAPACPAIAEFGLHLEPADPEREQ